MADGRVAKLLELSDARHRVHVAPELGGGIAAFEALTPAGPVNVLRDRVADSGALGLGQNALVPFSNRISSQGFFFAGSFHPVAPNLDGEPYPIHGDGFQRSWKVVDAHANRVRLDLERGHIGPFLYRASLSYTLNGEGLLSRLEVTNRGPSLPFGGGFHPWFPRYRDTRLSFRAEGVWLEDSRHLPTEWHPLDKVPDWSFTPARELPPSLINNAFTGWDGHALIVQPELGIRIGIEAAAPLDVAIVYSPDGAADFFCFEPVSHPVDAHNSDGLPGLRPLEQGETMEMEMLVRWHELT